MSRQLIQETPYDSPWTVRQRVRRILWELCWTLFCKVTPKPFNPWRLLVLKAFGAKIEGTPFVHQRAKIEIPENLTLRHRACLGDGAVMYSLGPIEIGKGATISQETYLCTGTHDFNDPALPLKVKPIYVGEQAFVGARAFVLPGVSIGAEAIIGACSVVTRNIPKKTTVAGNPAKPTNRKIVAERNSRN